MQSLHRLCTFLLLVGGFYCSFVVHSCSRTRYGWCLTATTGWVVAVHAFSTCSLRHSWRTTASMSRWPKGRFKNRLRSQSEPSSKLAMTMMSTGGSTRRFSRNEPLDSNSNSSNNSSSSSSNRNWQRCCVIVGGGPVGMAAALTLSRAPHHYHCIVLEQQPMATGVSIYDPTRAYLYNVNPRGLDWVRSLCDNHDDEQSRSNDQYPSDSAKTNRVMRKLIQRGSAPRLGVSILRSVCLVPSDPNESIKFPITMQQNQTLMMSNDDAEQQQRQPHKEPPFDPLQQSVWIPRHEMIQLLQEACAEQQAELLEQKQQLNGDGKMADKIGSIQVLSNKLVDSVDAYQRGMLHVHCRDGSWYAARLIVGADGMNSFVRQTLADTSGYGGTWLQSRARQFQVRSYRTPSAGIKIKCLQLQSNITLTNTDGNAVRIPSEAVLVFRSNRRGRDRVSLGLLPMKNAHAIRPANVVTRPDHIVWKIRHGPTLKRWFQKSFPRLNFDELVVRKAATAANEIDSADAEWDRMAKATGTTFPAPQYSPASTMVSPQGNAGIVLVGDACHAFPPDIGQGINAGLQDVLVLDRALRGGLDLDTGRKQQQQQKQPPTLAEALRRYERNRSAEHRALIRLARFGSPYQYNQSWFRDRIGQKLWLANVIVRLILNKVSGGWIPPGCMTLAYKYPNGTDTKSKNRLTYRQVMQRCDFTTWVFRLLIFSTLAGSWLLKQIPLLRR